MKYIVYLTVNTVNNKLYIGVHKTDNEKVFDGYLGNGVYIDSPSSYKYPKTPFQKAVKKYGPKKFIKNTLKVFDTEIDAYNFEAELVNEEFLRRDDVYNIILGGRNTNHFTKPLYMYALTGEFEKEFSSVREAIKYLKPNKYKGSHITRAIHKRHQFLGHQFAYFKVDNIGAIKPLKNRSKVAEPYTGKQVAQYDLNGKYITTYKTMTDCVKAGFKNAKLVATGRRKHCKNYVFKYLD